MVSNILSKRSAIATMTNTSCRDSRQRWSQPFHDSPAIILGCTSANYLTAPEKKLPS